MPIVEGVKFPYTARGVEQAAQYEKLLSRPSPKGFADSLSRAADSWMDHSNAKLLADRKSPPDRPQFMSDIGEGWILPEGRSGKQAARDWWGNKEAFSPSPKEGRAMADAFRRDNADVGAYMGRGGLGTPVYVGPGRYGASFKRLLGDDSRYEGRLGLFAPEGRYVRAGADTGHVGHELGHAKQSVMDEGYRGNFHREGLIGERDASRAAEEAVASYLGRRVIRAQKGWGAAAEDKSWAAYSGLPSYLIGLDKEQAEKFLRVVKMYERQYPGIADEVERVIENYDTLVAPKTINDTSRGDWSGVGKLNSLNYRHG